MNRSNLVEGIRRNIGFVLLLSAFAGSLLLNVQLASNLRRPSRPPAGVVVGSNLETIPTMVEGLRKTVKLGGTKPTILYIMAPSCVWCGRNLENIRTLAKEIDSSYTFVGLSNTNDGLSEYIAKTPLPFAVYPADMERLPHGLDAIPTPQLVVVGKDGKVQKVWLGALTGSSLKEVEAFFHVKLPGFKSPV